MIASIPKLARSELSSQGQNAAHSSSSGFNLLILDITFRNIDLGPSQMKLPLALIAAELQLTRLTDEQEPSVT